MRPGSGRFQAVQQEPEILCYEYEKRADDYYVSDYEEDFGETKFSAEQMAAMFDLKLCFQVKEVVEDLSSAKLEMSYLFQIEYVNNYVMFLEDIGNLLDYLGY